MTEKLMQKRPSTISIDLLGLKEVWLDWCRRNAVTQGAAFRAIVQRLTTGDAAAAAVPGAAFSAPLQSIAPGEPGARRITVRLTASELRAVMQRAGSASMTPSRWVVALVRGHLTQEPQIGQSELEALLQATTALRAIGRNLNQVTKALNIAPHERQRFRVDLFESIDAAIKDQTAAISKVLAANIERWRIE